MSLTMTGFTPDGCGGLWLFYYTHPFSFSRSLVADDVQHVTRSLPILAEVLHSGSEHLKQDVVAMSL